jgi:hypothetical protein
MSSAPDHLYLDLSIVNNDTSGDSTIPLNFREFRTNPILDNPANYFMSVARFEVDTPGFSLPMFIPKLRLDGKNENINSTAYSVSMAIIDRSVTPNVLTGLSQKYVEWSPQDKTAALPKEGFGAPNTSPLLGSIVSLSTSGTSFNTQSIETIPFGITQSSNLNGLNWTLPLQADPTINPTAIAVERVYPSTPPDNFYTSIKAIYYSPPVGDVPAFIELGRGSAFFPPQGTTSPTGFISRIYEFDSTLNSNVATTGYANNNKIVILNNTTQVTLIPYNPALPQASGIQTIVNQPPGSPALAYTYRFYVNTIAGLSAGNIGGNVTIINYNISQAPTDAWKLQSFSKVTTPSPTTARLKFNTNPFSQYRFGVFEPQISAGVEIYTASDIQRFEIVFKDVIVTTQVIESQDITTGYYNCYSARWWLSCVNKALADCYNSMGTLEFPPVANGYAPQFVIDADTNLITLMNPYIQTAVDGTPPLLNFAIGEDVASLSNYLGSPAGVTSRDDIITHSIFFNEPLFNLFSSLNSIYYGSKFPPSSLSVGSQGLVDVIPEGYKIFSNYIQSLNYNLLNTQTTTDPRTSVTRRWIVSFSEYSPVPMWNPIQSIVFTTSMIPIHYSMSNPPQVYGSTQYDQTYTTGGGNNSDISTQISDIQIPLTTGNEYKPTITYTPRGEYRMIDLLGNLPINQIGFAISYKTKFGQIIPFALGPQCGANLKILFRRKRYNLGNVTPYDTN